MYVYGDIKYGLIPAIKSIVAHGVINAELFCSSSLQRSCTALNVSPLVRTFTLWETIIANEMLIQYLTDVDFNSFLVRTAIVCLLKWSVNTVFNRVFYVLLILINSTQFYKFVNFRRINIHGVKNKMCKLFSIINAPIFKFFEFFFIFKFVS